MSAFRLSIVEMSRDYHKKYTHFLYLELINKMSDSHSFGCSVVIFSDKTGSKGVTIGIVRVVRTIASDCTGLILTSLHLLMSLIKEFS